MAVKVLMHSSNGNQTCIHCAPHISVKRKKEMNIFPEWKEEEGGGRQRI